MATDTLANLILRTARTNALKALKELHKAEYNRLYEAEKAWLKALYQYEDGRSTPEGRQRVSGARKAMGAIDSRDSLERLRRIAEGR